jgi:hypothetical protein
LASIRQRRSTPGWDDENEKTALRLTLNLAGWAWIRGRGRRRRDESGEGDGGPPGRAYLAVYVVEVSATIV